MSDYIVIRLCTGDQLLAEVDHVTTEGITVLNPIQVKTVPALDENGEYVEQMISNRFCQFTSETEFTFNHKDVLFYKDLNHVLIKYYKKLVLAFGEERTQMEKFYSQAVEEKEQELDKSFIDVKSFKLH